MEKNGTTPKLDELVKQEEDKKREIQRSIDLAELVSLYYRQEQTQLEYSLKMSQYKQKYGFGINDKIDPKDGLPIRNK